MKKLFGGLRMRWLTVILFAIAAGVYTGAVMLVPFLEGTSFQDIGISYEWWVVFAVIIVVNCRSPWEAMAKCFVFFLISQPLVYLVEVAFGSLSMELALHYYRTIWLPATFLTLPGGLIAYFCKKQTVLGGIILGLGNAIELGLCVAYGIMTFRQFPYHLLSCLFCAAAVVVMTLYIQKKRTNRIIAFVLPVVLTVLVLTAAKLMGLTII